MDGLAGAACAVCSDAPCFGASCSAGKCFLSPTGGASTPCTDGGAPGHCVNGGCCTGCVTFAGSWSCELGTTGSQCGSGGVACVDCNVVNVPPCFAGVCISPR